MHTKGAYEREYRDTENLMRHNSFIISWLRSWNDEKVMLVEVHVPVQCSHAMHNNIASHNLFIIHVRCIEHIIHGHHGHAWTCMDIMDIMEGDG